MKTIFGTTRFGFCAMIAALTFAAGVAGAATGNPSPDANKPVNENQQAQQQKVTDGQITTVLMTVDNNEIAAGQLALQKAESQPVKNFAQKMVDEHNKMNNMVSSLVQSAQIQSVDAPIAASLRQQGQSDLAELTKLQNGKPFELGYMQKQVAAHQMTLTMLDQTLLPSATNAELKTLIKGARPVVEQHLEMAKKILVDLSK